MSKDKKVLSFSIFFSISLGGREAICAPQKIVVVIDTYKVEQGKGRFF